MWKAIGRKKWKRHSLGFHNGGWIENTGERRARPGHRQSRFFSTVDLYCF